MQPDTPAGAAKTTNANSDVNPWLVTMGLLIAGLLVGGLTAAATNADPAAWDHNPLWWALGLAMLGMGGTLLAGLLVAGAIVWQLQRR
jgi:hypothetical protein